MTGPGPGGHGPASPDITSTSIRGDQVTVLALRHPSTASAGIFPCLETRHPHVLRLGTISTADLHKRARIGVVIEDCGVLWSFMIHALGL